MIRSRLAVLAATALAAGLLPALSTTGSAAAAPTTLRSTADGADIFSILPDFEPGGARVRVARDRRFNLTFTLAGLSTFSNMLGAFGVGNGAGEL